MDYMDFIRPISVIIYFIAARNYSGIKISPMRFLLWISGAYILFTSISMINNIAATVFVVIAITAMVNTGLKDKIISATAALFSMATVIIFETASRGIMNIVFYTHIDYYQMINQDFRLYMTSFVVTLLIASSITKFLYNAIENRFEDEYPKALNRKAVYIYFLAILVVFIFVYVSSLYDSQLRNPIVLIFYMGFFLFIVIYTYFIFTTSVGEEKLVRSKSELEHLAEYTSNIESMYNGIRSMRHDYANVISSMTGYITDNDMDGLKTYFKREIVPFADRMETEDNNLSALAKLKESSLKGLFAVKLIRAQESGVNVIVDINDDINIKSIHTLDLNRISGILLDNAYEAAMKCKNPYVHVGFINEGVNISIIIVNSLKEHKINMKKIFEIGYSTKGENRGYGLNNVTGILDRYPNVYLDTAVENNEFTQVIHIQEEEGTHA